jgi:hypothetical protein
VARRLWTALLLTLLAVVIPVAQRDRGTITGIVTRHGEPVPTADVEVIDTTTKARFKATTDKNGRYTIEVPAGTYEVVVAPLGFSSDRFAQGDQKVEAGKISTLDVPLKSGNDGVLGDDAAYIAIRAKYANLKGPLPRAGGKPDLSGMWNANVDPNPAEAELLPWAEAVMKERFANEFKDIPSSACLPDDPAWTIPILYKFIHTPKLLVMLTEAEPHYRQIFIGGSHPPDLDPTWIGHSVAKWDGDTLVVDTVGFNDRSTVTMISFPHTDKMHVVERFTRRDLAHMTHEVTITDPGTFKKPLVWNAEWTLAPGEEIIETICNENNKYQENIATK